MSRRDELLAQIRTEPPRCATCVHWDEDHEPPLGLCVAISTDPENEAATIDSTRDDSQLLTAATFGCTEHTPRPNEDHTP
jgi:hypothetical protein